MTLAEDHTNEFLSVSKNVGDIMQIFTILHIFGLKMSILTTSVHHKWPKMILLSFDYPILTYSPFSGDYTKNISPFEIDKRYIMRIFTIFTHFWTKNEHFQPLPVTGNEFFKILSEPWGPIVHLQKTAYEKLPPLIRFYNV